MRHGSPRWIASELGSATGFPKGNIIPQKRELDQRRFLRLGKVVVSQYAVLLLPIRGPELF